jgi:hypothetical protein
MKNETINLLLICVAYFAIGLLLAGNLVHDRTLKLTQDSVETLIKIEMITKEQFDLLEDKVERLENHGSRRIANTW